MVIFFDPAKMRFVDYPNKEPFPHLGKEYIRNHCSPPAPALIIAPRYHLGIEGAYIPPSDSPRFPLAKRQTIVVIFLSSGLRILPTGEAV